MVKHVDGEERSAIFFLLLLRCETRLSRLDEFDWLTGKKKNISGHPFKQLLLLFFGGGRNRKENSFGHTHKKVILVLSPAPGVKC